MAKITVSMEQQLAFGLEPDEGVAKLSEVAQRVAQKVRHSLGMPYSQVALAQKCATRASLRRASKAPLDFAGIPGGVTQRPQSLEGKVEEAQQELDSSKARLKECRAALMHWASETDRLDRELAPARKEREILMDCLAETHRPKRLNLEQRDKRKPIFDALVKWHTDWGSLRQARAQTALEQKLLERDIRKLERDITRGTRKITR